MDEQHSDNIYNFLSSRNPGKTLKQLDVRQIDQLFDKLRQHNDHLTQLARLDSLTQLPNRFYFDLSAKRLLAQAERHMNKVAVLSLDLDGFKKVNDHYGHAVGDKVLQRVAASLHDVVRHEDLVARVGGDEFIIILPCIDQYTDAAAVAEKVINAISRIKIDGYPDAKINCCIGIAGYPLAATSIADLLLCADKALYIAKNKGPAHFEYFTKKVRQEHKYAVKLLKTLQQNLDHNTLVLSYLPVYEIGHSHIGGVQVRVPDMQEVISHLQGNKKFYERLTVSYINKVYANYCWWQDNEVEIAHLKLIIDINEAMLHEGGFRSALKDMFSENQTFKQNCVLRVAASDSSLFSDEIIESYSEIGAQFCFTYNESQKTNIIKLRDLEPDYIDISLNAVFNEQDASARSHVFLKALITFVQAIGAKVILSEIDSQEHKSIVDASGADFACGSAFSMRLSSDEISSYLARVPNH